eukprot:scaffold315263_cov24-Attheya_sp.AAC.1
MIQSCFKSFLPLSSVRLTTCGWSRRHQIATTTTTTPSVHSRGYRRSSRDGVPVIAHCIGSARLVRT